MPRVLHSTEDVIEVLGGIPAVAGLTEVGITAVHNWRSWNEFPPRTYLVLTRELERVDCRAPAKLWKMLEPI